MQLVLILILLISSLLLLMFGGFIIVQNLLNTPLYVPSSRKKIYLILNSLGDISSKSFLDLGSGDGHVVFTASQYFMSATGVEINPFLVGLSNLRKIISRQHNSHFLLGSIYNINFSDFDVVYTYLNRKAMVRLEQQMESKKSFPKILVSNTFRLRNRPPTKTILNNVHIYIFV